MSRTPPTKDIDPRPGLVVGPSDAAGFTTCAQCKTGGTVVFSYVARYGGVWKNADNANSHVAGYVCRECAMKLFIQLGEILDKAI
jgi:hypothetical protein